VTIVNSKTPSLTLPSSLQVDSGGTVDVSGQSFTARYDDSFAAGNPGALYLSISDLSGTLAAFYPDPGVPGPYMAPGSGTNAIAFQGSYTDVEDIINSLTYVAAGTGGTDAISFDVWNQAGVETTGSIPVTIASGGGSGGSGPVLTEPTSETVAPGGSVAIAGSYTDSFADGHAGAMYVEALATGGTVTALDASGNPAPGSGTDGVRFYTDYQDVNAVLRSLTFTADSNATSASIYFEVWNQAGVLSSETLPITIAAGGGGGGGGSGPRVSAPPDATVQAGGSLALSNIWVNDPFAESNPGQMVVNISDSSGTLSMRSGGTSLPGSGSHAISFSGSFAQINAALQTLSYGAGATGSDTVLVNVWDQAGQSITQAVSVDVTGTAPVTRSWVGGGANSVLDAGDWSPAGVPQPGDQLQMFTGTAAMAGGTLANDTLILGNQYNGSPTPPNPVLNMSSGAAIDTLRFAPQGPAGGATVTVSGNDSIRDLDLEGGFPGGTLNLELNSGAVLHTTIRNGEQVTSRAALNVQGGSTAQLSNDGPSFLYFGTVDVAVVGTGSWSVGQPNSSLTFGSSVAAGQTVDLGGNSRLTLDDPGGFQGLVDLGQATTIDLTGLHGDAWSYQNDMLSIASAGTVVDTLRLQFGDGASSFSIGDYPSGVVIAGSTAPEAGSGVIAHFAS
jgi:hypothetical protein